MAAYEDLHRDENVNPSSNRTFGIVLGAFFALIGVLPLLRGHPVRLWALPLSAIFLLAALVAPAILTPLNRVWTALGSAAAQDHEPHYSRRILFIWCSRPSAR